MTPIIDQHTNYRRCAQMGCCCSKKSDPPPQEQNANDFPIPVIPVAEVHDSSIFDSPFKKKKDSEVSLLTEPEKNAIPKQKEESDSDSSVDQEMIRQLLNEVDLSDD